MEIEFRGDGRGVKACEECQVGCPEDLADVVQAALNFGRAFLRQTVGKECRIWELVPAGERTGERARGESPSVTICEVTLFARGKTPVAEEEAD